MGQIQSIEDLLNFLWRRRFTIFAVAVLGCVIAAIYAKTRPDSFESTAAIQVQGAQVGSDGAATGSAQVLQSIEQRLTTRDALLEMIARHGLYADLAALSDEEKVALLRGSVAFQAIESAAPASFGQPAQISAILITARYGTAEGAARIANDFAQGVLDMSASGQLDRARETYAFYLEEQARLSGQIAALESQIADYKNSNADALPTQAEIRREELVSVQNDLRALDQQMVALQEEQRQLAARGDLRATERRRLDELNSQIAVLTEQIAALHDRRDAAQAAIGRLPEVERGLSGMERELALQQAALTAATTRLAEAETAQRLAERQQGERFALLDRAVTPEYPLNSNGKKLFAAGALASVIMGIGIGFVLDLMRPVVRTSAQMERQLGLRPVIAIPELDFGGIRRRTARHEKALAKARALGRRLAAVPPFLLVCAGLTLALLTASAFV